LSFVNNIINDDIVKRLVKLVEELRSEQKEESNLAITRRAEDFPLMISQYGLSSTITFFLSKIGDERSTLLDTGLEYFKGIEPQIPENLKEDAGRSGKGYASYLSLVLVWPLEDAFKKVKINGLVDELKPNSSGVRDTLLENLHNIQRNELVLEAEAMPALLELKKILRALD